MSLVCLKLVNKTFACCPSGYSNAYHRQGQCVHWLMIMPLKSGALGPSPGSMCCFNICAATRPSPSSQQCGATTENSSFCSGNPGGLHANPVTAQHKHSPLVFNTGESMLTLSQPKPCTFVVCQRNHHDGMTGSEHTCLHTHTLNTLQHAFTTDHFMDWLDKGKVDKGLTQLGILHYLTQTSGR